MTTAQNFSLCDFFYRRFNQLFVMKIDGLVKIKEKDSVLTGENGI